MKIAIASLGDNLEAWVGTRHNWCSKFVVVDLETMEFSVHVVPEEKDEMAQHRAVIRTVAQSGAEAVIVGAIDERCQQVLRALSIEVIAGVRNLTVREAAERYQLGMLAEPHGRVGEPERVAVATTGETLEALIPADFRHCIRFLVVDPVNLTFRLLEVAPPPGEAGLNLDAVRTLARERVSVVLAGSLRPGCRQALAALAIEVHEGLGELPAREAMERYRQGQLAR